MRNENPDNQMSMIFIKKTVATSILATCKTVYEEANAIVQTHIQRFILESAPQVIFDSEGGCWCGRDYLYPLRCFFRCLKYSYALLSEGHSISPGPNTILSEDFEPAWQSGTSVVENTTSSKRDLAQWTDSLVGHVQQPVHGEQITRSRLLEIGLRNARQLSHIAAKDCNPAVELTHVLPAECHRARRFRRDLAIGCLGYFSLRPNVNLELVMSVWIEKDPYEVGVNGHNKFPELALGALSLRQVRHDKFKTVSKEEWVENWLV
jgi:hypothetical protein